VLEAEEYFPKVSKGLCMPTSGTPSLRESYGTCTRGKSTRSANGDVHYGMNGT